VAETKTRVVFGVRSRILLLTWALSIAPLILFYIILGEVLGSTRALVAKDAGDYAQRKTAIVNAVMQEDMATTLRNHADELAAAWQVIYENTGGNVEQSLNRFLGPLEAGANLAFVFDEEDHLIVSAPPEPSMRFPPELELIERDLQSRYLTAVAELPPTGYRLLIAMPRSKNTFWRDAAQKFRDDFTSEVQAKFDRAIAELRIVALAFFLALSLFVLVMARWLTKNLALPLENLATAMESFDGETPIQMMAEREDEIGQLTENFVEMTENLAQARQELEAKQRALERADQELMQLNLHLEKRIAERTADLQVALQKLREVDKNKDDFLSLVSHELKTPLTSIRASAEALMSQELQLPEEGRQRFLHIIHTESQRLTRLINDLLDLTGFEAGRLQFHLAPTDLTERVRETAEAYRLAITRKGLQLELTLSDDPRLRKTILDADRVVQVVTNLLGNAIKFTERGRISVTLDVIESGPRPMARLVVADTGIGIRPEDAHKVFDRFQQIEQIDTHHEGVGLGMPISKMIVEALGGDIHFASRPKHGTAFTVVLPLDAHT
jgi:signal transduction histidine kinase